MEKSVKGVLAEIDRYSAWVDRTRNMELRKYLIEKLFDLNVLHAILVAR